MKIKHVQSTFEPQWSVHQTILVRKVGGKINT